MSDKKHRQASDSAQGSIGTTSKKNAVLRKADPENFVTGVGSRPHSTKNDKK